MDRGGSGRATFVAIGAEAIRSIFEGGSTRTSLLRLSQTAARRSVAPARASDGRGPRDITQNLVASELGWPARAVGEGRRASRLDLKAYLSRRLDAFINPLVYAFWDNIKGRRAS